MQPALFQKYMESALAHDEEIICTNATVIVNSRGGLSWFNNEKAIAIMMKDRGTCNERITKPTLG